jgi:hypothetical protein
MQFCSFLQEEITSYDIKNLHVNGTTIHLRLIIQSAIENPISKMTLNMYLLKINKQLKQIIEETYLKAKLVNTYTGIKN